MSNNGISWMHLQLCRIAFLSLRADKMQSKVTVTPECIGVLTKVHTFDELNSFSSALNLEQLFFVVNRKHLCDSVNFYELIWLLWFNSHIYQLSTSEGSNNKYEVKTQKVIYYLIVMFLITISSCQNDTRMSTDYQGKSRLCCLFM